MSFTRLSYDDCAYKEKLNSMVTSSDNYTFRKPVICKPCYPYMPSIRLQRKGDSTQNPYLMDTNIESDLFGITRSATKCSALKYQPKCPDCICDSGEPCGQGVTYCKSRKKSGQRCGSVDDVLNDWPDCFVPPESTRLSNPPCTLRGTGWNRWEWLCQNPQDRVEVPFDYNINNRIIVKDNHRPCIPTPIDQTLALPKYNDLPTEYTRNVNTAPTFPPSVHWQSCNTLTKY